MLQIWYLHHRKPIAVLLLQTGLLLWPPHVGIPGAGGRARGRPGGAASATEGVGRQERL